MAERVDLDAMQAICEPTALVPGFDGTGMRVLLDANSQAVIIRLRDLQRLLVAMAAELRGAREVAAAATLVERHKPMHRWACNICKLHGAVDAYAVAMTQHADPSTHDRSGPGDG